MAAVEDGASVPDHRGRRHPYDGAHRRHLHRRRPARAPADARRADAAGRRRARARWPTPRSTRRRAARRPSSGSSASAARSSACTTPTPRRRRTTPSSAWACASWSTARSGLPPPSTCGRRRRPTSSRRAMEMASVTSQAGGGRVELAPEPSHGDVAWSSAFEIDPSDGADGRQDRPAGRLEPSAWATTTWCRTRRRPLLAVSEQTLPGRPQRDAGHPAPGAPAGRSSRRWRCRTRASRPCARWPRRSAGAGSSSPDRPTRGTGTGRPSWRELPELLAEKLAAPSVEAGTYDLVVDPSNLWLTIHESIGHATELDRAMGYEAAYAGTSFATFDKLGSLAYGSPVMHVTGDRTVRARAGHHRHRQRGRGGPVLRPGARRRAGRLPARPLHRRGHGLRALQRLRVRRLADARADPAHGQRVAGPCRSRRPEHRRAHRRRRPRHLHRGRQELVHRHAALQLPVHRAALLPDRGREAGRAAARTWRTRRPPPTSGAPWRPSAAHRPGCSAAPSTAARASPGQVAPVSHGCPSVLVRGVRVLNAREESGR